MLTGEVIENIDIKDIEFFSIDDMEMLLKNNIRIVIADGMFRRFIYEKN